jgi:hypothetical protein
MGSSVPPSTSSQTFQAYTPNELDWLKFGLQQQMQGLQMQYYTPMLKDTLQRRKLYKGVMEMDPESLRRFAGMPPGAVQQDVMDRINRSRGIVNDAPAAIQPNPQMPGARPDAWTQGRLDKQQQSAAMADLVGVANPYAKQGKAAGGIMQAKRYADGGKVGDKGLDAGQAAFVKQMANLKAKGKEPTAAQKKRLDTIEQKTGRDVSPYTNVGTKAPTNKGILKNSTALGAGKGTGTSAGTGSEGVKNAAPVISELGGMESTYGVVPGYIRDDKGNIVGVDPTKPITTTDPWVNKTLDYLNQMQAPAELGQSADMFRTAGAGLQGLAGYKPQDVSYQNASAERASAERAAAAQMGSIANVNAERAAAERAQASQMAAIADVNAQQVNLGQYNVDASQMQRPEDVTARELQRYQMDSTSPITTQALEAYQMAGPGSWTDEGVSGKYMSPYMQGVIDISKREAERDYTKQMNALNAKAVSAGAFGGSRQALERSEAQRNYNQQLQDIQTRGLQQAYESGRSQYTGELSMSQQAALQNLQSKLSTQSQSSQQELQAMLANQNIDYQTKVQNLQSMLGVQSQEAQQMLQAALANQQVAFGTGQTNAQLAQQAALANQGVNSQGALANQAAALQAALANQQTQFGTGQFNAGAQNQASLANAQLGTQANLANQRAALEAALANQQTQFGVGSLNANLANQTNLQNASLGTQAALQNAQLGTNVNLANSQYGLQSQMANQQAGLQGNQQNIAAYGAMGNMATGLGSIGTNIANFNQQQFGNLGAMGNTWQSGMTTAENQRMINEYNSINPATPLGPVWSAIGAAPSGGGGSSSTINRTP